MLCVHAGFIEDCNIFLSLTNTNAPLSPKRMEYMPVTNSKNGSWVL